MLFTESWYAKDFFSQYIFSEEKLVHTKISLI